MRRLLVWMVVTISVLIAAFISSAISLSFFCSISSSSSSSSSSDGTPQFLLVEPSTVESDAAPIAIAERVQAVESDAAPIAIAESRSSARVQAGCDYTVGKWVKSNRKPLYAGNKCKQWLAGMWACRLMPARPNFDYEKYRWQPQACDLPVFNRREFFSRMRNKVLAFVGDSIGRQQYQSLMCMLTAGKDDAKVEDVSTRYGLIRPRGAVRADGVAQRFLQTNTTIIYYWSASLCDIQPINQTDPHTSYAMHLDRPAMFLLKYLGIMDVLVLNTGHHWNKGKITGNNWVMHVNGEPVKERRFHSIGYARNFSLPKIVSWLDHQVVHNRTRTQIYMRSLSPRHFFEGEWDSGGRCDNNRVPVEEKNATSQLGKDPIAEGAVMGTRVHLLNITYISLFRDEAHISKYRPHQKGQDCLHWCLPGVPDVWNELLYAKLFFDEEVSSQNTLQNV
ncbi:hypothetical protein L7F22_040674 [Adiantum nelumboides]|nr:hypothetical protein [Adiantum nelumboides]